LRINRRPYGVAIIITEVMHFTVRPWLMMEELHTDSIDGGHEASYGARSRARERAYSNKYNARMIEICDV
jgi:hypothetical protein